jgi:hypothetical protein
MTTQLLIETQHNFLEVEETIKTKLTIWFLNMILEKKDENLEIQLNYSHTVNDENTVYDETISNPTFNFDRTNIVKGTTDYFQFNADYINPITETTKLELGVETRIQNSGNRFNDINPSFTSANNSFEFGRNIYSAYANLGKQIGKWSGQLGVRLEYFDLDADFAINETNPKFFRCSKYFG